VKEKKQVTKLTLEDIPKINSPFREELIKNNNLTEKIIYKEAWGRNTLIGFSTEELKAIEEKYKKQGGMSNEDIQREVNTKRWLLKPDTIKNYIKKGLLPLASERKRLGGKVVYLYPRDFMHHLNFVRFLLNAGREVCMNILDDIPKQTSNKINDRYFLKKLSDYSEGYDSVFQSLRCRLMRSIEEDISALLGDLAFAESVIDGNTNDTDRGKEQRKMFEDLKKTVQNNSNFDNALKLRIKSYMLRIEEIEYSIKAVIEKVESIESEAKNALWTSL